MGRSGRSLFKGTISRICVKELRKTTKDRNLDSRSPGRESNQGPDENGAGGLSNTPRPSVVALLELDYLTTFVFDIRLSCWCLMSSFVGEVQIAKN
jgi:hypothetical protein